MARPINIALLASGTAAPIADAVLSRAREEGIEVTVYLAPYNQYRQVIYDEGSEIYRGKPHIIFLALDYRAFFEDVRFEWSYLPLTDKERIFNEKKAELSALISACADRTDSKIVVHDFDVPANSPLGILEHKQPLGFSEMLEELNRQLKQEWRESAQVFVFGFRSFIAHVKRAFDHKLYYLADMYISPQVAPLLAEAYFAYIRPLVAKSRKCLVVDLDNVLWGGVVGEEGKDGIALGPTVRGRPFFELQKYLFALWKRGVMLAVNSANNEGDALDVIRTHPYMVLREPQFAASRINWDNKAENMKALATELGIGLDSMVFLDDDPAVRHLMRTMLPEVYTVELPRDVALYLSTVESLRIFDALQLTSEDLSRSESYAAEKSRRRLASAAVSLEDFHASLGLSISIATNEDETATRVAQLLSKTNQFNLTTRRYSEEEVRAFLADSTKQVYALRAADRFGDYGITGAALVEKRGHTWHLDTFLLSCRILGKKIEHAFIAHIIEDALRAGATAVTGEFTPTEKNMPAAGFLASVGFSSSDDNRAWRLELTGRKGNKPHWITTLPWKS